MQEGKNLKRPYPNLKIDDNSHLFDIGERFQCSGCKRSRKFFCYSCSKPHPDSEIPIVKLPIKIDIVKHKRELVGKSTSCHARLVSQDDVKIYDWPDIPDYREEEGVALIFLSPKAIDIKTLFKGQKTLKVKENFGHQKGKMPPMLLKKKLSDIVVDEEKEEFEKNEVLNIEYTLENLPIKRAVFIDSTWSQCKSIFQDERLKDLTTLIIQNRLTKYWRPNQKDHPKWFLSTIEAIHQFLFEFHVYAWGIEKSYFEKCLEDLSLISTDWIPKDKIIETPESDKEKSLLPYNGQYDNLLYYFSFCYSLVHSKVKKFRDANEKDEEVN